MNDVIDIESDKVNSPHRPIPSGKVTKNEAAIFSVVLFLSGLVLSY